MMMMIDGGSSGILELLFIIIYYVISYLWLVISRGFLLYVLNILLKIVVLHLLYST